MPKSLAAGHMKITFLTDEPADPAAPTATELNAGIDASPHILDSAFTWQATDSDKVNEKPLSVENNVNSLGPENFTAAMTLFREYNPTTGAVDPTGDVMFAAVKVRNTTLWGYARLTSKKSTADWAATDEIFLGLRVITDTTRIPQDLGGYIKAEVPMEPQEGWPNIEVAA